VRGSRPGAEQDSGSGVITMMDFFAFWRRRPPVDSLEALAEFIDRNAAFLVQKGIYEYSRARAGHYSKVLFGESEFQDAVERARWRAYPLGLAMVAELTEGLLQAAAGEARERQLAALRALVLSIFDRYPVPSALGGHVWGELRADLDRRLQLIGLHAPKRAMDIPEQFARSYFELMPIHQKLRSAEFPTIANYLRVTMCNIHDELTRRLDAQALSGMLTASTV
jgi:hypothetical protein